MPTAEKKQVHKPLDFICPKVSIVSLDPFTPTDLKGIFHIKERAILFWILRIERLM